MTDPSNKRVWHDFTWQSLTTVDTSGGAESAECWNRCTYYASGPREYLAAHTRAASSPQSCDSLHPWAQPVMMCNRYIWQTHCKSFLWLQAHSYHDMLPNMVTTVVQALGEKWYSHGDLACVQGSPWHWARAQWMAM